MVPKSNKICTSVLIRDSFVKTYKLENGKVQVEKFVDLGETVKEITIVDFAILIP